MLIFSDGKIEDRFQRIKREIEVKYTRYLHGIEDTWFFDNQSY